MLHELYCTVYCTVLHCTPAPYGTADHTMPHHTQVFLATAGSLNTAMKPVEAVYATNIADDDANVFSAGWPQFKRSNVTNQNKTVARLILAFDVG